MMGRQHRQPHDRLHFAVNSRIALVEVDELSGCVVAHMALADRVRPDS